MMVFAKVVLTIFERCSCCYFSLMSSQTSISKLNCIILVIGEHNAPFPLSLRENVINTRQIILRSLFFSLCGGVLFLEGVDG